MSRAISDWTRSAENESAACVRASATQPTTWLFATSDGAGLTGALAGIHCAALNAEDFGAFVGVLCDLRGHDVTHGRLYGPVTLAQGEHLPRRVDVFIGKAVFAWSATTRP